MNFDEFAAAFTLSDNEKAFLQEHDYDKITSGLAACPEYLLPEFFEAFLPKLDRYGEKLRKPLQELSFELQKQPALQYLAHILRYFNFIEKKDIPALNTNLPDSKKLLAEREGLFNLLIAFSGMPLWEESYRKVGVPQSYADAALGYFEGAIDEYAAGHNGALGFSKGKLHWIRYYIKGILFRIGRFEYMMQEPLKYVPAMYREKKSGRIVGLCKDGWKLREDGLLQWTDEDPDEAYLTAALENDCNKVVGTPLDPRGFALVDEKIELKLQDYEPLFQAWDLVPGLHIPGGGKMTPEACRDSFLEARAFFKKYFKRDVPAIVCFSWIFNPDFEEELPNSNLAKLMKEVFLFPFASVGVTGLQFVFGRSAQDWSDFPRDNSLREAFHRIREKGKRLKAGGMIIERQAIENYGKQFYRN